MHGCGISAVDKHYTFFVAECSVSAVLDGRMYNQGVRLHKLVYTFILRLACQGFIPWIECNHANKKYNIDVTYELVSTICGNILWTGTSL